MGVDPTILSKAGRLAYDDSLTIAERRERLEKLLAEGCATYGEVAGYMEMLSMLDMAEEPVFLEWSPHGEVLRRVKDCGALQQVEDALREAYARTEGSRKRLCPSSVVEQELKDRKWVKRVVWAPDGLAARDSFDGWKEFPEADLSVAVEVEWPWQRVMGDLLKFWRAERGKQVDIGIEVLRGRGAFEYVTCHVYRLYEELLPDLRVVFCALAASDLEDQKFPAQAERVD